jgi:hypothetical protein
MDIEDLKELEARATTGRWEITDTHPETGTAICAVTPDGKCRQCLSNFNLDQNAQLTIALRNLAPELIALWEADKKMNAAIDRGVTLDDVPLAEEARRALNALNAKAKSMVI